METKYPQTNVVIIGGGMAGLTTACYLAHAGMAVTLFEKAANLGGRAATQNHEGYSFNRGIHALYSGGATSEVLQELGITYTYGCPKATFALYQGKLNPLPTDPVSLVRSPFLNIGDKLELVRVFASLPRLNAQELARISVQEWLDTTIRRPHVRQLMAALGHTFVYSAALDLVSAEVFIDKLQRSFKHPIHYIDGGWQSLVNKLYNVAEQAGARIISGIRVESIAYQDGQVQGVRLRDGNLVPASAVIIATTPKEAAKLLEHDTTSELHRLIETLVPAQVACLDVALSHLPCPHHPVVQDLESPRFQTIQSLYSRIAPQGCALISTFKQLDPNHPTDPRADERELEGLLDATQPGWRDMLVKRSYLPRIEAVGTLPTAKDNGFAGRPTPQIADIANLYLVGDWIGPTGFLSDASTASARQVAHLLLKDDLRTMAIPKQATLSTML